MLVNSAVGSRDLRRDPRQRFELGRSLPTSVLVVDRSQCHVPSMCPVADLFGVKADLVDQAVSSVAG